MVFRQSFRAAPRSAAIPLVLSVAGLVLGGCTASGYWHRPGATPTQAEAEVTACAAHFDRPSSPTSVYHSPVPGGVGGALAMGAAAGIAQAIAAATAFDHCMRDKGYEHYAMTDAERARLSALSGEADRDRYFHELMANGGENVRLGITKAESTRRRQEAGMANCPPLKFPCE